MYAQKISLDSRVNRRGSHPGASSEGHGGESSGSHEGSPVPIGADSHSDSHGPVPVPFTRNDFPNGNAKVVTYGRGGGSRSKIKSGPLKEWTVGGGGRPQVYGDTYYFSVPPLLNTLPFGFIPIPYTIFPLWMHGFGEYSNYTKKLENVTRPGGELVEMKMTPVNITGPNPPPFYFVADSFTAGQINITVYAQCPNLTISDPIPFNSTGDIEPGSVVQLYRGATAAVLLQGYDDANEQLNNPNPVPNPPFSSDASMAVWSCLNTTIGASIPLREGARLKAWYIVVPVVLGISLLLFLWWLLCKAKKKKQSRKENYKLMPQYSRS